MPFIAAALPALTAFQAVSLGATALSTGAGIFGAIGQANASSSAAKYQSQVAANNATVANQNATLATEQAAAKTQSDYRAGAIRLGAQRAALGAAGGTLDSGSALAVQTGTAQSTALATSNDLYEGSLQAYSLRNQASNFTAQQQLDQQAGSNAQTGGLIAAGGSLLAGAGQFASKWNSYLPANDPAQPAATHTPLMNRDR